MMSTTLKISLLLILGFVSIGSARKAPVWKATETVSENDIKTIQNVHNDFRNRVASGNEDKQPGEKCFMRKIIRGDKCMAGLAQKAADQGKLKHNFFIGCQNKQFGQNLAYEMKCSWGNYPKVKPEWEWAITKWYNESLLLNEHSDMANLPETPVMGHYTQVVWDDTSRVGCGYSEFKSQLEDNGYTFLCIKQYYACNYEKAGNVKGVAPYQNKKDGEDCSKKCSKYDNKYKHLCLKPSENN